MRLNNTRKWGNFGEKIAVRYLLKQKYQIIACHYQKKIGEVDIIALDPQNVLVFFEVKTRSSKKFGQPEEAITPLKIKKMIKTANWFLSERMIKNQKFRFDVLAINLDYKTRKANIRHYKNITQ